MKVFSWMNQIHFKSCTYCSRNKIESKGGNQITLSLAQLSAINVLDLRCLHKISPLTLQNRHIYHTVLISYAMLLFQLGHNCELLTLKLKPLSGSMYWRLSFCCAQTQRKRSERCWNINLRTDVSTMEHLVISLPCQERLCHSPELRKVDEGLYRLSWRLSPRARPRGANLWLYTRRKSASAARAWYQVRMLALSCWSVVLWHWLHFLKWSPWHMGVESRWTMWICKFLCKLSTVIWIRKKS